MNTAIFLRLLSPSPFLQPPKIEAADLPGLRQLALDHGLFMLLYSRMQACQQQFPGDAASRAFIEENKSLYLKGVSMSMRQEAAEGAICGLLKGRGIQAIVIKGNALARDLYGDPNCRSAADIDLLVRREDAAQADEVLKEAGYACDVTAPFGYCIHRQHHAGYHHPTRGQHLELHWLFAFPSFFSLDSGDIWRGVVFDGSGAGRLTPEMTVLMLLIHHHLHSFRELRILVDILWALHRHDPDIDWGRLTGRLSEIGLAKTTAISLSQLESLWPEEAAVLRAVNLLKQGLGDRGCSRPLHLPDYFRMDLEQQTQYSVYRERFMARFALDGRLRIMRSFLMVLLPAPEAIRALYSDHRIWTLPLNYLRYLAWRIRDWTA